MKLARLTHHPSGLIDFFQEGLETLGAVCERSWHDRLQLVAEGPAAKLWNPDGALLETELRFPPPDESGLRDAAKEVFPGCPLTFHLAEALRSTTLSLERVCLSPLDIQHRPPASEVAEKLWHAQYPGTTRWRLEATFKSAWHFSLLLLVRCEIQAIDQHWSLHRVAFSLPDGQRDDALASGLDFVQIAGAPADAVPWPAADFTAWQPRLRAALEEELSADLAAIRQRQENYLRRELERIDAYFAGYERELVERVSRSARGSAKIKIEERLAAAKGEHARRRADQVHRHEIRVIPHVDALLLLAEPAWTANVTFVRKIETQTAEALFIPRARRWATREKPGT